MARSELRVLAVVPARGGSKGVPRKNLRKVSGKSLIAWTAEVCRQLPWIDRAILSTDDEEIAAEGRRCGLEVPFMRPGELAGDDAKSNDMWQHCWLTCERTDQRYDVSLLLEPTSPLRAPGDVEETFDLLVSSGAKAAATVSRTPSSFTPHKTLLLSPGNRIAFYHDDGASFSLRQNIPPYYHRNGVCYAVRRETLLGKGHIIEDDCVALEISHPLVNIDTESDLEFAEFLIERAEREGGDAEIR